MCTWSRDKTTILQTRSNSHSYNFIDTHAIVHVNKLNIVHCFAYKHTHTWHTHTLRLYAQPSTQLIYALIFTHWLICLMHAIQTIIDYCFVMAWTNTFSATNWRMVWLSCLIGKLLKCHSVFYDCYSWFALLFASLGVLHFNF